LSVRDCAIKAPLRRRLRVLARRDKALYEATKRKMHEVATASDLNHYKNLRAPLQAYKRVHVGSFVLFFSENDAGVVFHDLRHHDDAYETRR
jgi:mRNA-degrading endonuclease RelE of RelBE toxin-antitoxin system